MIRLLQNFVRPIRHITSKQNSMLCVRSYEVYFPNDDEIKKNKLENVLCFNCNGHGKMICGYCSGTGKVSYEQYVQEDGSVDKTKYICDDCTHGITICITCLGTGKRKKR